MTIPKGIIHVSDQDPGYSRKRQGQGFIYLDEQSQQIQKVPILERIEGLGIPPAWERTWICKSEQGHLQASGYDEKERKQYVYHPRWMEHRQKNKFNKLYEFALALPQLRQLVEQDLNQNQWPKTKILALVVTLLDKFYLRIGNENYRQKNQTYGLTTLRRKHLETSQKEVSFHYKAKSGKYRKINVRNNQLMNLIKKTSELPGYEIFRYLDARKKSQKIDAQDVNEYLREITGEDFTSKNFRTWGGTSLAVSSYPKALQIIAKHPRRKLKTTLVKEVAQVLGNTVSICEKYYIHPKVLSALEAQALEAYQDVPLTELSEQVNWLTKGERLALKIIASD